MGGGAQPIKAIGLEFATAGAVPSLSLQSGGLLFCSLTEAPFLRSQRKEIWAVAAMAVIFVPRRPGNHGSCEAEACLG